MKNCGDGKLVECPFLHGQPALSAVILSYKCHHHHHLHWALAGLAWHVCHVENVSSYVQLMLFCCKIDFVVIYGILLQFTHFCRRISFVAFTLFCVEKIASVEKK